MGSKNLYTNAEQEDMREGQETDGLGEIATAIAVVVGLFILF